MKSFVSTIKYLFIKVDIVCALSLEISGRKNRLLREVEESVAISAQWLVTIAECGTKGGINRQRIDLSLDRIGVLKRSLDQPGFVNTLSFPLNGSSSDLVLVCNTDMVPP